MKTKIFKLSQILLLFIITISACKDKNINCLNGGTVVNNACVCPTGFSGTFCENSNTNLQLIGSAGSQAYNFIDVNNSIGSTTGELTMKAGTAQNTVLVSNLLNLGSQVEFQLSIDFNASFSINIPNQIITGATNKTISGAGQYNQSSKTVSGAYTITQGLSQSNYTFTWTKK